MQKATLNKSHRTRCPQCGSSSLTKQLDRDLSSCIDCGFVNSQQTSKIFPQPTKRIVTAEHNALRLKDKLSETKRFTHQGLSQTLEEWKKTKTWDSTDNNLVRSLDFISNIAVELSLPKKALEASTLTYKAVLLKGLLKGRSMNTMVAAAIYVGCMQTEIAVTINDIARVSNVSAIKICRYYKFLTRHLKFRVGVLKISEHSLEISTRLRLSDHLIELIKKTALALDESKDFVGKAPVGVACAGIYLSSILAGEAITQRAIAEAARITEATIRSRCRDIEKTLIFSLTM
jgi:transcription initiation factor TFIIB